MTANYIQAKRRGEAEGKHAEAFLLAFDAEACLQLGMVADAGDESIQLTRYCDAEDMDIAILSDEVARFEKNIGFLFDVAQAGCTQVTGYTQLALQAIRRVRTFIVAGVPVTFGCPAGAPDAMVKRCLQRMSCWTVLARSVLQSEFPDFDILVAFDVFSLAVRRRNRRTTRDDTTAAANVWERHVARLASAFEVDATQLARQTQAHLPIAASFYDAGTAGTMQDAWRAAVRRTMGTHTCQEKRPSDTLRVVLIKWFTIIPSTSGVEQGFAKMLHTLRSQQRGASEASEADTAKVVLDRPSALSERERVAAKARCVWTKLYGKARAHPSQPRFDKGVSRQKRSFSETQQANTEIGWLRMRRGTVDAAAGQSSLAATAAAPGDAQWLDGHSQELTFQKKTAETRGASLAGGVAGGC